MQKRVWNLHKQRVSPLSASCPKKIMQSESANQRVSLRDIGFFPEATLTHANTWLMLKNKLKTMCGSHLETAQGGQHSTTLVSS